MSADLLREAAADLRSDWSYGAEHGNQRAAFMVAVADWLADEAEAWDACFAATQAPGGFEDPGGIFRGRPDEAARCADGHARRALAVAAAHFGLPART